MKRGLRWGMQFGVPVTAELLTVCVGIRGDAGQVNQCVLCRGEHFEMFQGLHEITTKLLSAHA